MQLLLITGVSLYTQLCNYMYVNYDMASNKVCFLEFLHFAIPFVGIKKVLFLWKINYPNVSSSSLLSFT